MIAGLLKNVVRIELLRSLSCCHNFVGAKVCEKVLTVHQQKYILKKSLRSSTPGYFFTQYVKMLNDYWNHQRNF